MSFPMQKDIEEPLLREIAQRGGEARPNELFEAVARHFPQLTEADLKIPHGAVYSPWSTRVHNVRAVLVHKGELNKSAPRGVWRITDKGRQRIGLPPSAQTQVPPETPPPRHEVLKQKLVEIGKALGYHTKTEEGPMFRHDVLWKQGEYRNPSHVIEVCEGGSLPKDFAALNWARENWGAHCLLVVTDEKDCQKAKQVFISHPEMRVVMATSIEGLHQLISKDEEFFSWLLGKR